MEKIVRSARRLLRASRGWLGSRDSNPDSTVQSRMSYHWTTPQHGSKERGTIANRAERRSIIRVEPREAPFFPEKRQRPRRVLARGAPGHRQAHGVDQRAAFEAVLRRRRRGATARARPPSIPAARAQRSARSGSAADDVSSVRCFFTPSAVVVELVRSDRRRKRPSAGIDAQRFRPRLKQREHAAEPSRAARLRMRQSHSPAAVSSCCAAAANSSCGSSATYRPFSHWSLAASKTAPDRPTPSRSNAAISSLAAHLLPLVARVPAEKRQEVEHRLRKEPGVAVLEDRGRAVPLREALLVGAEDQRKVCEQPAASARGPA